MTRRCANDPKNLSDFEAPSSILRDHRLGIFERYARNDVHCCENIHAMRSTAK